jgi:hypothetical protein
VQCQCDVVVERNLVNPGRNNGTDRNGLYATHGARYSCRGIHAQPYAAVSRAWEPSLGWDRASLTGEYGVRFFDPNALAMFIRGLARAIGPLVKYYRATRTDAECADALRSG